jgi:hypothetical protein
MKDMKSVKALEQDGDTQGQSVQGIKEKRGN